MKKTLDEKIEKIVNKLEAIVDKELKPTDSSYKYCYMKEVARLIQQRARV